jgi:hypothetical protein
MEVQTGETALENSAPGEAARNLVWLEPESGHGSGLCAVTGMMAWALDEPGPDRPDYNSIVFVKGPTTKYSEEELRLLAAFGARRTAKYDRMFTIRRGCNAIIIDKVISEWDGSIRWLRKRMSWERGAMHSPSLPAAFVPFDKDDLAIGQWLMLKDDPRMLEIVETLPWEQAKDPTHRGGAWTARPSISANITARSS